MVDFSIVYDFSTFATENSTTATPQVVVVNVHVYVYVACMVNAMPNG